MLVYNVEGYFSKEQCIRIKEKLQGKTYFNFNIQYGGMAGNNNIIVTSDNKDHNNEELKSMFIFNVLNLL